jgi:hypothetical protein
MTARILPIIAALCALAVFSCDPHSDLRVVSSESAVVTDWGGKAVCDSTPCVMRVSRETCRFLDSSSGHVILEARSRGGVTLRSMPIVTCDVTDRMRLLFTFPAGGRSDCGVALYEGNAVVASISCSESLVK